MKCARCEQTVITESATVTDHRYIQSCIDALKARIKMLEDHIGANVRVIVNSGMPEAQTKFGAVSVLSSAQPIYSKDDYGYVPYV